MALLNWVRRLRALLPVKSLSSEAAYALWATSYPDRAHNPMMRAEEAAMRQLLPSLSGARVLDLACGTGRWGRIAREMGATTVFGIDNSLPMLRQASLPHRAQAALTAIPCPAEAFEVALCGLAVGHLPHLADFASEAARVLVDGGTLLLSDYHVDGRDAGWQRVFTAPDGRRVAVDYYAHALAEFEAAYAAKGLSIEAVAEPRVGFDITESFPGSEELYTRYYGLHALLIVRARKTG